MVYTLANDRVLDWLVAFCESLRKHEPDAPLTVIPFDDRVSEVAALAGRYGFRLLDDPRLAGLDRVERSLWPERASVGALRKLAMFWGDAERFMFLDSDIVVLGPLGRFPALTAEHDLDLLVFDIGLHQAYEEDLAERMAERYGARGFNTGALAGRSGLLTPERLEQLADEARPVSGGFIDSMIEQSFINYCADVDGWRVGYVHDLMEVGHNWAAMPADRAPFLHWSGFRSGPFMPHPIVFLRHRLRGAGAAQRARYVLGWLARARARDAHIRLHWARRRPRG